MTIKVSTALRNSMLASAPLNSIPMGVIKIYAGTVPASADDALGGATLLCTIRGPGDAALNFAAASGGVMPKDPLQAWSGINITNGVASFYRHCDIDDTGLALVSPESTLAVEFRIQGNIATAGGDMNFTSTSLVMDSVQTIDFYTIEFPSF